MVVKCKFWKPGKEEIPVLYTTQKAWVEKREKNHRSNEFLNQLLKKTR